MFLFPEVIFLNFYPITLVPVNYTGTLHHVKTVQAETYYVHNKMTRTQSVKAVTCTFKVIGTYTEIEERVQDMEDFYEEHQKLYEKQVKLDIFKSW